jgi:hypothetical protein
MESDDLRKWSDLMSDGENDNNYLSSDRRDANTRELFALDVFRGRRNNERWGDLDAEVDW